jgi:general secretion pathway protein G
MNKPRQRRRRGFTLIEVLLVLAILGVIAAFVVPSLLGRQQTAYVQATRTSVHGLEQALKMYAIDHDGEFPPGSQDALAVLMEPMDKQGKAMQPYLEKLPTDAWGEMLYYEYPNTKAPKATKPAIWSAGLNHQNEDGGGDDINNWSDSGLQ